MIINGSYGHVPAEGKYKFLHENLTLEQIQTSYRDTSKQMDNLMEDYNMTNKVYLALYKHKRSFQKEPLKAATDAITRILTKGKYSHCELVIEQIKFSDADHHKQEIIYQCFSSSVQDGGVRCKEINMMSGKWDLIELRNIDPNQILNYFNQTKGMKYDWWGAIGVVIGIKQKRSKYFCSEWCYNALAQEDQDGWRFSPNDLAVIFKRG